MSATPHYSAPDLTLHLGDCRKVLAEIPDASVDAICTDPPYELGFMGRAWDASGIAFDPVVWRECLRVLKPGGHLVAFGGTRTYHRLAVAIEDAGFEIRDSIHWIFGSGFPKGQDMGKAIDRRREDRSRVLQVTAWLAAARDAAGWTNAQIDDLFGYNGMGGGLWTTKQGKAAIVPQIEQWDRIREAIGFDDTEIRPLVLELNERKGRLGEFWDQREVVGTRNAPERKSDHLYGTFSGDDRVTIPARDEARTWAGWNTSLKPAHEPIVLARKSTGFNTTVANVLEYGTGALNIDACRIGARLSEDSGVRGKRPRGMGEVGERKSDPRPNGPTYASGDGGRWPANIVFTHHAACVEDDPCEPDCPVRELDRQSGARPGSHSQRDLSSYTDRNKVYGRGIGNVAPGERAGFNDQGGASRFFPTFRYEAKAPASERPKLPDGTAWPTVKPLALMRWLVRLVTPPGGTVLDPFAGSGTTGEAAIVEGFQCVLIERDPVAAELIKARLTKAIQPSLFGEVTA